MVKHIFDRYFLFSKPPKIRTVEGLSAIFAFVRCEHRLCSQTRRDTNFAIPGYSISAMIPRRREKSKIFLSVVIYVVKAAFIPLSAIGGNPANTGVTRLCGVSPCLVSDTATALPNHPRYQLRHTRLYLFFSQFPAYWLSAIRPRRFPQKHSRGSSLGSLAPLLVSSPRSNAFFRPGGIPPRPTAPESLVIFYLF